MSKEFSVSIRAATKADMPIVHRLVQELAIYEKAEQEVITTVDQYVQNFEDGWFDTLIAIVDEVPVGMALFHHAYSTWKGPMIYLEDLIVTESMRGKGIGLILLERLYEISIERNAKLLKWQVLDWNEPAINFYKNQGVELDPGWINCKKFL